MANTGKQNKNMGSDSLILLYCLSSLVAMTAVMVVSHPWKRPFEALWACFALWLLPSPRWKQSLIVRWAAVRGVTGCLNSVTDNCTIGTGRPPLFIWGNYPLENIAKDVCYAQNWTRKTTTHARFLKVLSLNVIATKNMWAQCAFVWDGVHLIPILIKFNQYYGMGSVSYL